MLIALSDYATYGLDPNDTTLAWKLGGIEGKIRSATHNGFHVAGASLKTWSDGGVLCNAHPCWSVGDTLDLTGKTPNDGVAVITAIDGDEVTLDRSLFDCSSLTASLVRYPQDVINGALGMLDHDNKFAGKSGIASESLSRHSVSYVQPSGESKGYPEAVTAFLKPYAKAWF